LRNKRRIPALELVNDVRAGLSDEQLRNKYDVTAGVLQYLLKRLAHSGLITEMELFERTALSESDLMRAFSDHGETVLNCPICGKAFPDGQDQCWNCDTLTSTFDLKMLMESIDTSSRKQLPSEDSEDQEEVGLTFAASDVALVSAVRDQSPERIREMLDSGANVNCNDEEDVTPLMAAASLGLLDVVQLLLDRGADVNAVDRSGANAFFRAYSAGHGTVARVLAARGSDVTSGGLVAKETDSCEPEKPPSVTVTHEAIQSGVVAAAHSSETETANLGASRNSTRSGPAYEQARIKALAKAAGRGMLEQVELLLNKGVEVDAVSKHGNTALMRASFKGHLAVARFLLERGADINAENAQGNSAVLLAAGAGHSDVVGLLLETGAAANTKNVEGHTPLLLAAGRDEPEIVEALLKYGANPDEADKNGDSPLMKAAENGFFLIAMLLLESKADVNAKNRFGNTALMKAAFRGNNRILKLLLEAGPDVNATNIYGNTALMKAAHKGHVEAAAMLLKADADPEIRDNEGNTALMRASGKGDPAIAALLSQSVEMKRAQG
jgi:uncharacterized protein